MRTAPAVRLLAARSLQLGSPPAKESKLEATELEGLDESPPLWPPGLVTVSRITEPSIDVMPLGWELSSSKPIMDSAAERSIPLRVLVILSCD